MKKILSVALSTAMAFSMFASVAFGDTAVTPQAKFDALKAKGIFTGYPDGSAHLEKEMTRAEFAKVITKVLGLKEVTGVLSYKDKGYTAKNWAVPYIEAVSAAGIMQGKNVTKKIFDFNGKVTVEEMATVLTRALELEVPTTVDNSASTWAKGYVQAAINAGLVAKTANFQSNATRTLLVESAFAVDEIKSVPTVASYVVSEGGKVVEFTLSNKEVVKVTLEKALEANKETEVKFKTAAGKEITTKVTYKVTTATKVEKVSTTNLKEVVVAFDGTVDEDTATDVSNYSLKSGKALDSAKLSDDKKTVTLSLVSNLTNNKVDYLNVSNIKAGDKVVSAKEVEFSISDNELPKVESVKSLGTKSVKVVFSEPVQLPQQSNFELDGKAYFGKVTQPTSRTVVLTPYNTTALTVGDHKLAVIGVKDFANFVSLTTSHDIKVAEDKDLPTITAATATLESVTLTFSEEVDPDTLDSANVYWKSGSSKITATGKAKALADNKYKFTFDKANSLPTGTVAIYVDGVKDYSGNQIAKDTSITVNAEIDQTRPEVRKAEVLDSKRIQVTFSKTLLDTSVRETKNYAVLDKDGKVISVKEAKRSGNDNNIVTIELYTALSVGDNTLTIKNVKDNTRLENTMLDYSSKINAADKATPKLDSKLVSKATRTVIVGFDKKMDPATLADYSNYHVQINDERVTLTSELADITVLNDGREVAIRFNETYKGQTVRFDTNSGGTSVRSVQKLYVLGVKDSAGNLLKEFVDNSGNNTILLGSDITVGLAQYDADHAGYQAALTAKDTIEVKFSSAVSSAPKNAFVVMNGTSELSVKDVILNGTSVVKLVLDKDFGTNVGALTVTVDAGKLVTSAGTIPSSVLYPVVLDKVAPTAKANIDNLYKNFNILAGDKIAVDFTESVILDPAANLDLLSKDFEVKRYSDNEKLTAGKDFILENGDTDTINIVLKDQASRKANTKYIVTFAGSKYLTDLSPVKNQVASFSDKETNGDVSFTKAAKVTVTGPSTIAVVNPAVPVQYTTVVKDQNDVVDANATVSYEIVGAGVTVSSTGVVTVSPTATAANVILRVTSTSTSTSTPPVITTGTTDFTISLNKGAAVVSNVVVNPATDTSVAGAGKTVTYTATVNDQYGQPTAGGVNWSLVNPSNLTGLTLTTTGQLTVAPTTAAGIFSVVAKSAVDPTKTATVTYTVTPAAVNFTTLSTAIDTAVALEAAAAEGTNVNEYTAPAKANYVTAINNAKAVKNNVNSTQVQVDQAASALATATGIFNAAKN